MGVLAGCWVGQRGVEGVDEAASSAPSPLEPHPLESNREAHLGDGPVRGRLGGVAGARWAVRAASEGVGVPVAAADPSEDVWSGSPR